MKFRLRKTVRTRKTTVDTTGPGSVQLGGRRK